MPLDFGRMGSIGCVVERRKRAANRSLAHEPSFMVAAPDGPAPLAKEPTMTDTNIENATNTAGATTRASKGTRKPRAKSVKAVISGTRGSISLVNSDGDAGPAKAQTVGAGGSRASAGRNAGNRKRGASSSNAPEPTAEVSKSEQILKLLRRKRGAGIAELQEASGWQAHSVRGFLTGHVKKKLGLEVISEAGKDGIRRYRVDAASQSE